MLGYVVSNKRELKVREAELYKAYYCGVCKSIGRNHGQLPRMILSYDAAFLSILIDSLVEDKEEIIREGCIINPLKKKPIVISKGTDISADIMLILGWFKILDDIRDEGSTFGKLLKRIFGKKFQGMSIVYLDLICSIEENISRLNGLEYEKSNKLDQVADCFAKIMEDIFSLAYGYAYGIVEPNNAQKKIISALGQVGYHLGRWVYIVDSYDDIEEDLKKGSYNAVLRRFDYKDDMDLEVFKNSIRARVEQNLLMSLDQASKAIDLLPIKKNRGILDNIIYVGLLNKTEEVLDIVSEENKDE